MKIRAFLLLPILASWFWQRPAASRAEPRWPGAIPALAADTLHAAYTRRGDAVAFVCYTTRHTRAETRQEICRIYAEAGWTQQPVQTAELLLFTRGDALASVLVQETSPSVRVTILQRARGL